MERQLDASAGALLKRSLEERGLKFVMPAQTAAILGEERVRGVRFGDGTEVPADLVVMAVGIRPNAALAKASGIACDRGVLVNDTMQTYDPRIYALGECVQHRGACYGLVAPLFEQAKVVANHLAEFGIGRYAGSQTSTKLKVTGIDLFSAGDFTGGGDTEELVFKDAARGVYKKLVVKGNKIQGAVLYGDTVDGAWYFQLMRDGTAISDFRENLLFGQAHIGDSGTAGADAVTGSGRHGRDLRLQRRLQGRHRQGDRQEEPVHARRGARAHQGVVVVRLVHGPRRAAARQHARRRLLGSAGQEADVPVHDLHARGSARRDRARAVEVDSRRSCSSSSGRRRTAATSAARAQLLPAVRVARRVPGRQAVALHQRARARQHPARRHVFGRAAHVGRCHVGEGAARDRRRRREIRRADGEGHGRPAHRFARRQERGSAERLARSQRGGLRLGPRLRQGAAHGEDLRRQGVVPVRHAGLHGPRHQAGTRDVGLVASAQGEARRVGLPTQLRRGDDQGSGRRVRRLRLRAARRRQRRHQDPRDGFPLQGGHRGRGHRVLLRVLAALPRGSALPRAHGAVDRARRACRTCARRIVDNAKERKALYARFLESQKYSQIDPWAERAAGKQAEEFAPLHAAARPELVS